MSHTIKRGNQHTLKILWIVVWVHTTFQPTVHNIRGLRCRLQYFCWMENSVHLKHYQQSGIQFICVLPGWFQIRDSNI